MKKATEEQLEIIMGLVSAGVVSSEEIQQFIDTYGRRLVKLHQLAELGVKGVLPVDEAFSRLFQKLEPLFPKRGKTLVQYIRPLIDWKPELRPYWGELEEQAWLVRAEINGIRPFRPDEEEKLWERRASLAHPEFTGAMGVNVLDAAQADKHLDKALETVFTMARALIYLPDRICQELKHQVRRACYDMISTSRSTEDLKHMRNLWLIGNYPLGLDAKSNLLLLVSDY